MVFIKYPFNFPIPNDKRFSKRPTRKVTKNLLQKLKTWFYTTFLGQTYTLGWNVSNNLHSLHNLEILRLKTSLISVQ